MGLYLSLWTVSDEQIAHLRQHPEDLDAVMGASQVDGAADEDLGTGDEQPRRPPAAEEGESKVPELSEALDLEKDWHALHFLLTGTADGGSAPLCYLLNGGVQIASDTGFSAHGLTSQQVREFADALSRISTEELLSRFQPDTMTELAIYPDVIWERDPPEELREFLAESYEKLQWFVSQAAEHRRGLIVYIG